MGGPADKGTRTTEDLYGRTDPEVRKRVRQGRQTVREGREEVDEQFKETDGRDSIPTVKER